MNIAVSPSMLCLAQYNSFGAKVADVAINPTLEAQLQQHVALCKLCKTTLYLTDNPSDLRFEVNADGYRLLTQMIKFQGPCLPIAAQSKQLERTELSPIYRDGRRYQGD